MGTQTVIGISLLTLWVLGFSINIDGISAVLYALGFLLILWALFEEYINI